MIYFYKIGFLLFQACDDLIEFKKQKKNYMSEYRILWKQLSLMKRRMNNQHLIFHNFAEAFLW